MFHTRMKDKINTVNIMIINVKNLTYIITSLLTQMYTVLKNILIMLKILFSEVTYVN